MLQLRGPPLKHNVTHRPLTLSVIVIAYDMAREIPRTLQSLARTYQQQAENLDYEIIVVDNGSPIPLDANSWRHIDAPVTLIRLNNAHPSPAKAMNSAAEVARGDWLCLMVDGAHVLTPGVFQLALAAGRAFAEAVVAVRYFFLGPDEQNHSIAKGYCQAEEDNLLDSIQWPADGYRLFEIGTPFRAGATSANWLHKMFESNCLFIGRSRFETLGGMDEDFDLPGGGFVSLDLYKRACDSEGATPVQLIGEGSFHQIHGGTTTNVTMEQRQSRTQAYQKQYEALRNTASITSDTPVRYMGHLPSERSRIHRYFKG